MSRCGESGLFESRHSVKNKKLFHQTVKELFVVGVTGFEPTASWSRTKRATNCATPRKKIRSSEAAAVVGDERIELPQTESESVALPLCKSPISLSGARGLPSTLNYYIRSSRVCQHLFSTFAEKMPLPLAGTGQGGMPTLSNEFSFVYV